MTNNWFTLLAFPQALEAAYVSFRFWILTKAIGFSRYTRDSSEHIARGVKAFAMEKQKLFYCHVATDGMAW